VETVKGLFESSGAAELTRQEIEKYTKKAFAVLEDLQISEEKKELLFKFGKGLMNRQV
jgi:geranylgeranyl diphosphate synthase type II